MAHKPSKKEAAIVELAEGFLRVLQTQRALGADAYPLPVQRLVELTDPQAPAAQVKKALNKRRFVQETLAVRAKAPDAPIALAADVAALAASPLTLEFLLRQARTAATQAFGVADLKKKAATKLQKPFQEALTRRLAENTLPPTVGWVSIIGRPKLFLLSDLRTGAAQSAAGGPQTAPPAAPTPTTGQALAVPDFATAFDAAFDQLDRAAGGHNFVSLVVLRQAVPVGREAFDRELHELRRAGRYRLSAAEGRHGISPEEREAAVTEEGSLLLFVSRSRT